MDRKKILFISFVCLGFIIGTIGGMFISNKVVHNDLKSCVRAYNSCVEYADKMQFKCGNFGEKPGFNYNWSVSNGS